MLIIRILNVGQGSSIIIERKDKDVSFFGVIDSNYSGSGSPKVLLKLKELGAQELSFVALTHPHRDHFSGLYSVILEYNGKIGNFYSCPFGDLVSNKERFKKYAGHLAKLAKTAGSTTQRRAALELVQILAWADTSGVEWYECAGDENRIAPLGFEGIDVFTLTPTRFSKGDYVSRIDNNDPWMYGSIDDNDISLSFSLSFMGQTVVLGGDASKKAWTLRQRFEKSSGRSISAGTVNLPHHGSLYDSPPEVLKRLFSGKSERYGITSAGGLTHPSIEIIDWLNQEEIDPYCTNLIAECGNNTTQLYPMGNLDLELARVLREAAVTQGIMQPCQGDVTITIDAGRTIVTPEIDHFCPFRKASPSLFPLDDKVDA